MTYQIVWILLCKIQFIHPDTCVCLRDLKTNSLKRTSISKNLLCENTHLCSSLHKILTSRRELMGGWIEREAGSQGKEQKHNNFVVRTPREDGVSVTI